MLLVLWCKHLLRFANVALIAGLPWSEYMVPDIIMPLEELPRLPNGKINRRALPEPDFQQRQQQDYSTPSNEVEQRIQQIWQEVS